MVLATHELVIDLDSDGLFADTEVTDAVDDFGQDGALLIRSTRGRDQARLLAQARAGSMEFDLDNQDGGYDPGDDLTEGQACRWRMTDPTGGAVLDIFTGILDAVDQAPGAGLQHAVRVPVTGNVSRLVGRRFTTELYEDEDTGALIGHVLDAAGYPKNLTGYLDGLSGLAGGWNLASTSGTDPDTSGNGNNATVTVGGGTRGAAAIEDGGTLSLEFDPTDTEVDVSPDAAFENLWDEGGGLLLLWRPASVSSVQALVAKGAGWDLLQDSLGRLLFRVFHSTTAGNWTVTGGALSLDTPYLIAITYDAGDVANNPTIYVGNLSTGAFNTYTVGDGITETSPAGTRTSDAASDFEMGHRAGSNNANGTISVVRLFSSALTTPQVKAAFTRALNAPRHLDEGREVLPFRWWRNEDAWAAIVRLVNTEGPGAALYEDGTGAIVFKNRHAVLTETRSNTVQTTFATAAGGSEPLASAFQYDAGRRDQVKHCEVEVVRRSAKGIAEVWALGSDVTLAPGETWTKDATFADAAPVKNAATPSSGSGDYTVSAGSLSSVSLNRTSGGAVTITLVAGASGATVTGLRLRAELVSVDGTTQVRDQQGNVGDDEQSYQLPVYAELDLGSAQDFCDAIVGYYENGRPRATVTLEANVAAARMTAALTREVNDRVHVTDGMTGVDAPFIVHQVSHEVLSPNRLRTTFGVEEALPGNYFLRFGTGQLGVSRLGY